MKITSGIIKEPKFIVLFGTPGIGKTTFIAEAPKPIILDPEKGSNHLKVDRNSDISTYQDFINSLSWLRKEKHDFKTLGIDSLDHIEPLIWNQICKSEGKKNIEECAGGFQKGYGVALEYWRTIINMLRDIRSNRGMNVIAVGHARVVTVNDPTQSLPYERYTLKLHENKNNSAIALWKESVDAMLFATYEDIVFKVNDKDKKGKASGEGIRKLYATRTAAWDAKNRYGLPQELPFSLGQAWSEFEKAADLGQPDSVDQVVADIAQLLVFFKEKDPQIYDRMAPAVAAATEAKDLNKLIGIRNHARTMEERVA
jgi:hypothetical protein